MNEICNRPWGHYETLYESETYKVKRIVVKPNQAFSLQYHKHRWEDWIIVEGSGIINMYEMTRNCVVGERFHIPPLALHRVTAGPDGLTFVEVQRGICNEEDIVRIEDNYGRT